MEVVINASPAKQQQGIRLAAVTLFFYNCMLKIVPQLIPQNQYKEDKTTYNRIKYDASA